MATAEQQPLEQLSAPAVRVRIAGFVVVVQTILFLVHWFVYQTWTFFRSESPHFAGASLQIAAVLLSITFVAASLLAFRYSNAFVRAFYTLAAVWLGFVNFLFIAAFATWTAYLTALLLRLQVPRSDIATATFGAAILVGFCGLINARWIRTTTVAVTLPNLPPSWRGRTAALVSDVHLGSVNGFSFMQRIVAKLRRLHPDIVFIAGDLYDGAKADLDRLAAPWREISPPFGSYYVTGNHEEFSDRTKYLTAVSRSGVRVLNNEKVTVDGLQLVGVHDGDAADPHRLRSILDSAGFDRTCASILLTHVPSRMSTAAIAGISLQLSGHTHGGQVFPFTWFTQRIFRQYTYGLNRFANLLVYTSSGAGTWGPPMRVGTRPEIVFITFE